MGLRDCWRKGWRFCCCCLEDIDCIREVILIACLVVATTEGISLLESILMKSDVDCEVRREEVEVTQEELFKCNTVEL